MRFTGAIRKETFTQILDNMSDKRAITTDALATLGTIISDGGRDAIHLAVEPVIAGERLNPAQDIGIIDGKAYSKSHRSDIKMLGIVDPFLKDAVESGQKFWLIVYPRQITSLRHVWSHPDFEEKSEFPGTNLGYSKSQSEKWLRDWCDREDDAPSYDDLVAVMTGGEVSESEGYGTRWRNEGDYLLSYGRDAGGEIPIEVWVHLENVIGHKLDSYPSHFSCSC